MKKNEDPCVLCCLLLRWCDMCLQAAVECSAECWLKSSCEHKSGTTSGYLLEIHAVCVCSNALELCMIRNVKRFHPGLSLWLHLRRSLFSGWPLWKSFPLTCSPPWGGQRSSQCILGKLTCTAWLMLHCSLAREQWEEKEGENWFRLTRMQRIFAWI